MISSQKLSLFLTKLLFFLLPTQLAYHFWPDFAFVYGFRVDYLSPAIYLTDLILISILLINWKKVFRQFIFLLKKNNIPVLIIILAIVNIIGSVSLEVTLVRWIKVLEVFMFYFYLTGNGIIFSDIYKPLYLSAILFSLLGVVQFVLGGTIGLSFLGERTFTSSTPGIALTEINGQEYLRSYSTFGHPNSMAGFVGVLLILFVKFRQNLPKFLLPGIFIIFSAFLLSFSLGAYLAMGVVLIILLFRLSRFSKAILNGGIVVSLISPMLVDRFRDTLIGYGNSFTERAELSAIAGEVISRNVLFGTGLNTFIANLPMVEGSSIYIWLLQPVHNMFLLIFSETGIFIVLIVYMLFNFMLNTKVPIYKSVILFIFLTGLIDHYWITQQQNLLLMTAAFAFIGRRLHAKLIP